MMNFVFPPAVEAAIAAGKYVQVYTSAGVPIGMARDAATGQFVAHAVGATVNNSPLSPLVSPMQFVMGGLQMQQTQMGFQAVQASLGVLQATTAVIGVGTLAGVALSAVNLHQTLKLKKAVERLEVKLENGFINLEQLLKEQGTEIKQLIFQVLEEMKFENHRLVLVRAYGLFTQAIQRMRSALQLKDIDRRNAEIDAARGMLFEALADYKNPQLLEETCAAGQLRRLECSWAIEQSIIATYQVQNEFGAASDRISQLQEIIRQDGLRIIEACDSDDELDFLFPEITRIHNHDLVLLDTWHNQIEWTKALPPSELKQLHSADFSKSNFAVIEDKNSAATDLAIPDEQLFYENLRPKSHFYALRTQLELMLETQRREDYTNYIIEQGQIAGHKSLVSSNLEQASDLAIANLFYYFKVRDKSEEEKVKEQIYEKLKAIIVKQLEVDASEVTPNANIANILGANSNVNLFNGGTEKYLELLELFMAIEEEFDIEILDEAAEKIRKVQQVVDYIYQKVLTSETATLAEDSSASDNAQPKIPETTEAGIEDSSQVMKEFGLTPEQTRIMFSYQYHLVQADIDSGSDYEKNSLKREWLCKWKKSTTLFLNSQITSNSSSDRSLLLITDFEHLKNLVKSSLIAPGNQLTRCLILLEVTLFQPYYPLGDNRDEAFKNLKIADEERLTNKLRFFARTLDLDPDSVHRFKSNYKEAIKGIKGGINPLLVGIVGAVVLGVAAIFATPLIAGLLAPILAPGLYGAAAVSAVLAALGGGAIAAGGFGMAGGMAVIVAGGSILGAGAGVGVGALFGQSPDAALTQAAKLEVAIKEIVFIQKDSRKDQEIIKLPEIIKQLRLGIRSLEDKLDELLLDQDKNQQEIENMKKAIEYLKKALERIQGLM